MLIKFAVKHKPTGYYIPQPEGRQGRGGSFEEPNPDQNRVRLFKSERAARIFITTWCKGKHYGETEYDDYTGGSYTIGYSITPEPSRIFEDMEIVKLEIPLP